MMRTLDTLVARLILVSLVGITLVHLLSIWSYEHALDRELSRADDARLAERIASIKRSAIAVPESQREALAHELSSGPIEAHWNRTRGAAAGGIGAEHWQGLIKSLRTLAPELGSQDIVLGTSGDPHSALLSIRLPDATWINVNLFAPSRLRHGGHGTIVSTSIMAAGVVLIAVMIAGWLTRPLRAMAAAVKTLSPDQPVTRLSESGPAEVRQLAHAFNEMQSRISELLARRTLALAAVSHDLRTPLTRLKLRLDDAGDASPQRAMLADVAEMEAMIEATLSYLRGQEIDEPMKLLDLSALLQTVVGEAVDAGHDAVLVAPAHLVVRGRHMGLKRALNNLVGNATRFGTKVTVTAKEHTDEVSIEIADNGPGIPQEQHKNIFEPFVRLENSRNRESGGVGLGLTIAKSAIEANGGTLVLRNRLGGGLEVVIRLPQAST